MTDTTAPGYIPSNEGVRDAIVSRWTDSNYELTQLRQRKTMIAEQIKALVASLSEQRRLVRVVAPELLHDESNGE